MYIWSPRQRFGWYSLCKRSRTQWRFTIREESETLEGFFLAATGFVSCALMKRAILPVWRLGKAFMILFIDWTIVSLGTCLLQSFQWFTIGTDGAVRPVFHFITYNADCGSLFSGMIWIIYCTESLLFVLRIPTLNSVVAVLCVLNWKVACINCFEWNLTSSFESVNHNRSITIENAYEIKQCIYLWFVICQIYSRYVNFVFLYIFYTCIFVTNVIYKDLHLGHLPESYETFNKEYL